MDIEDTEYIIRWIDPDGTRRYLTGAHYERADQDTWSEERTDAYPLSLASADKLWHTLSARYAGRITYHRLGSGS